jgi:hypothetical protein
VQFDREDALGLLHPDEWESIRRGTHCSLSYFFLSQEASPNNHRIFVVVWRSLATG